jgi:hypothetical protein
MEGAGRFAAVGFFACCPIPFSCPDSTSFSSSFFVADPPKIRFSSSGVSFFGPVVFLLSAVSFVLSFALLSS